MTERAEIATEYNPGGPIAHLGLWWGFIRAFTSGERGGYRGWSA